MPPILSPIALAGQTCDPETEAHTIASDLDRSVWSGRYSPDGRWITFPAVKENVGSVIYTMPAEGGGWLPISDDTRHSLHLLATVLFPPLARHPLQEEKVW